MPQGGSLIITTSTREVSDMDAHLSGAPPGRYVELVVADTGVGITEDVRSHLFEPFYTTKEQGKGTGLGLSTVYGIIRHHGGYIGVESQPGKGARFRILLPALLEESAPPNAAPVRSREIIRKHRRVYRGGAGGSRLPTNFFTAFKGAG